MTSLDQNVQILKSDYYSGSEAAWNVTDCPNCGPAQVMVLAFDPYARQAWMRCGSCKAALVRNGAITSPAPKPLGVPKGLPEDEAAVWNEVRASLGVGAYTGAVMLCRKILFHVAVANGLPEKNDNGRAPGFKECTDFLVTEGVVTKRMLPWVERIKDVGNEVNHELDPITKDQAMDVAQFTEQLLKLAHEMDAIMNSAGQS